MKVTDQKIISHLRKNARKSLTEISKETKIPVSTIFKKIKDLENNVIKKYVALIHYENVNHHHWNILFIKIPDQEKESFEDFLIKHPNINTLCEIFNVYNYKIETVFKNMKDYFEFIKILESKFTIEKKQECNVIKEIKKEEFVLN